VGQDPEVRRSQGHQVELKDQVTSWNTKGTTRSGGEPAQNWPTPRSHEDGEYQYDGGDKAKPRDTLTGAAQNWATPTAHDGRRPGPGPGPEDDSTQGRNLKRETGQWMTPRIGGDSGKAEHGDLSGQATEQHWMTPTSRDGRDGRVGSGFTVETNSLLSRQAPTTSRHGIACSVCGLTSCRRSLNAKFVEWLQGWGTEGWTSLAPLGCDSQETV
jgi:hypothetical protein